MGIDKVEIGIDKVGNDEVGIDRVEMDETQNRRFI